MKHPDAGVTRGAFVSAFETLMAEARAGGARAAAAAKRAAALALELDPTRAEEAFAQIVEVAPEDAIARLALAQLQADRGALAAARTEAARAFADAADEAAQGLAAFTLGEIACARGDRTEARTGFESAMRLQQAILARDPVDFQALRHFARARQRHADLFAADGDLSTACREHAEALSALEALSQRDEARISLAEDLAHGCGRLAALSDALGEAEAALRFAETRIGWLQRLSAGEPNVEAWRHDLAEAWEDRAGLDLAAERWKEAQEAADQALRLRVGLAASAPHEATRRAALARAWSLLAEAAARAGDAKTSRAAAAHARMMCEQEADSGGPLLFEALLREGRLALRDEDFEAARVAFARVCETAQSGAETDAQRHTWLAEAWEGLGDVGLAAHRFAFAQDAFARARAFRGEPDPRIDARLTLKLGEAALGADDIDQAQAALSETCALRLALLEATPGDPKLTRDLAVGLARLGLLAQALGDVESARAAWLNELALADLLRAGAPEDEHATRFCAVVCAHLATLGDVQGEAHRALAMEHLDALAAMGAESKNDRALRARLEHD